MTKGMVGRGLAKGNLHEGLAHRTPGRTGVPGTRKWRRVAAKKDGKQRFTALIPSVYGPRA